ncbi:MAG: DEAD/DEAH box helicase [Candidatus Amulumruptor caecigallinarius]|nr:DEAD/DEAH box helicase [Candidatus Amulumruptor caecigallinarius]
MRFDEILTNDDVLDGLWDMHFDECTPVQEHTIPAVMQNRDILACAQTGTGKTAAYLLPVINKLADGGYPDDAVNCIVMAPTRELAQQIDRQLQGFAYFMPVSSIAVYGGTDGFTYEQQRKSLKLGTDIVIATPGRLLAHLSMGYVDLSKVSFFILDEADRMLDMGFYDDIMQIFSHLPKNVQILMFSATMPANIRKMADKILKNPVEIKLAVSKPAEKIEQSAYICHETQKINLLKHIFNATPPKRVIIFSSSKLKVKNLSRELRKMKLHLGEMHSDLNQLERDNVMLDFKSGKINVVVATDIISRGIDIDDIEMVVNFDVPRDPEDYVHRIGRTARANRNGRAVTFVAEDDFSRLARIERLLEKEVPKADVPAELGEAPLYYAKRKPCGRKKRNNTSGKLLHHNKPSLNANESMQSDKPAKNGRNGNQERNTGKWKNRSRKRNSNHEDNRKSTENQRQRDSQLPGKHN